MKYNNLEKAINNYQKRSQQSMELGNLYVECDSYEEFRVRSALELCYTIPKWFDKYWWHYLMANYDSSIVTILTIASIVVVNISINIILWWLGLINLIMFCVLTIVVCPAICVCIGKIINVWNCEVSKTKLTKGPFKTIDLWERTYCDNLWKSYE